MKMKHYLRDSLLGALGAALMLVGDLCLSVIPASQSDSGLFLREAYLSGTYPAWRLPLLLATGVLGMALCCFAVRVCCVQIRPQYRRTRQAMRISGAIYLTSAGVIHLLIGSMANWISVLSPLLGREETAALIQEQYGRLIPMLLPSYAAMVTMILVSAWAVLAGKTILPRRMLLCHLLTWQLVFMLIPDVRQALGAEITTWDFVLSQGSGNAALLIWMLSNALWAAKHQGTGSSFLENTRKPEGAGGRLMVSMMNIGHRALARWGLHFLQLPGDAAVLDCGCGGGANIRTLLKKCPRGAVKGLDYSAVSVETARKVNAKAIADGRCVVWQGSVEKIIFASAWFDAVTAFETVYFWPDLQQSFREVCRVLKPGGTFLICNECSGDSPGDEKWTQIIPGMTVYRDAELKQLLEQAGFCNVRVNKNQKGWLCLLADKPVG